jgi:multidrug efflux pump subunit AcrA (membrane-fusion protein)
MKLPCKLSAVPRPVWIAAATAALLGAGTVLVCLSLPDRSAPVVLPLSRGPFRETLRLPGLMHAKNYAEIRAPDSPYERQTIFLAPEGSYVKKDEIVAAFDTAPVLDHIELETEVLEWRRQNLTDIQIEWMVDQSNLSTDIDRTANLEEIRDVGRKSAKKSPRLVQELAQHQYVSASLDNTAAETRMEGYTDLNTSRTRRLVGSIRYRERRIEEDKEYADAYVIRAPMDSLVYYPPRWVNEAYRKPEVGDYLTRNVVFMQLPDLASLIVKVDVPENRIQKIRQGAAARFTHSSTPGTVYEGVIDAVSPIPDDAAMLKGLRTFETIIRPTPAPGSELPPLMPGAVVEVELVLDEAADAIAIPLDYLEETPAGTFLRWRQPGKMWRRDLVQVPVRTADYALFPPGASPFHDTATAEIQPPPMEKSRTPLAPLPQGTSASH